MSEHWLTCPAIRASRKEGRRLEQRMARSTPKGLHSVQWSQLSITGASEVPKVLDGRGILAI